MTAAYSQIWRKKIMDNTIEVNEVSKWALRLKMHYKKGVNLLDCIFQAPVTAKKFIDEGAGLLCIYGVIDRNAAELIEIVERYGYGDEAFTRYLNILLVLDMDNMAAYTASQTAMRKIAASTTAMTAVAASPTAMAAIWNDVDALAIVQASSAWEVFTSAASAAIGKAVAMIAGLNPNSFADMEAVAESAMPAIAASETAMMAVVTNAVALTIAIESSTAMTAVAESETAMGVVVASSVAMSALAASAAALNAVVSSYIAMAAIWLESKALAIMQGNGSAWVKFTGAVSAVIGKAVAMIAGLNPNSFADMAAVAASNTAMTSIAAYSTALAAVWTNDIAIKAVQAAPAAWAAITSASSDVLGKSVAIMAKLEPDSYADVAALAASPVAMAAVAAMSPAIMALITNTGALGIVVASSTAMTAIAASSVAIAAVIATTAALTAVAASTLAMTAVVASSVGFGAIRLNAAARNAVTASSVARSAIAGSDRKTSIQVSVSQGAWNDIASSVAYIISLKPTDATFRQWTINRTYAAAETVESQWQSSISSTDAVGINRFTSQNTPQVNAGATGGFCQVEYIRA